MSSYDILELQRKLMDAQEQQREQQQQQQQQTRSLPYFRMRAAAINEAVRWIRQGMSVEDTSNYLNLSVPTLHTEIAKMSEYDKARRRFLSTGIPGESEGGYFAIVK